MNLENSKQSFNTYSKSFDMNNENISRKYYHTYRVMSLSQSIAESLNLTQEQVDLSIIIGLLHDIARFEQWTKYETYSDLVSFDHGEYGVKILEENNFIREFIKEDKYDDIIKKAIRNHNKLNIEEGLSEEELLQTKIIKDADKLDIYFLNEELFEKYKDEIENGIIKENVIKQIKENTLVRREKDFTPIDRLLVNLAFVFDLNFKYSFKYLKEKDYINKIIDRFSFKNKETKIQIEEIRKIINEYILEKIEEL